MQDWHIRGVRTYGSKDSGRKAAPSAEDGRDTDQQLHGCCSNSDDVRNEKPASGIFVRIDAFHKLLGEEVFDLIIKAPNLDRVEPVLCLALRARRHGILAIIIFSPTVVPQPDGIKVLEFPTGIGLSKSLCNLLVRRIRYISRTGIYVV